MSYSAWNIWWHPCATARLMEDMENNLEDIEALRQRVEELTGLLQAAEATAAQDRRLREQADNRVTVLREEVVRLNDEKTAAEEESAALRAQLRTANTELTLRKDTESQLQNFEKMLSAAEQMKANYERRIATLRDAIVRLKERYEPQPASELQEIDMKATAGPTVPSENTPAEERRQVFPGNDWLMPLPE